MDTFRDASDYHNNYSNKIFVVNNFDEFGRLQHYSIGMDEHVPI